MMAINPRNAPDVIATNAMAETASARRALDGSDVVTESFELGGALATTAAAPPLPLYTIPIAALAEDRPSRIGDATQHAWRVATTDSRGRQLVDLSAVDGKALAVRGRRSVEILEDAGRLAESSLGREYEYEPRMIDFGQLGLSALWLHSRDADDRFFKLGQEATEIAEADLLAEASAKARNFMSAVYPEERYTRLDGSYLELDV